MNRISSPTNLAALAVAAALASGCTTMAGVGGTSEYSCKAPEGVKCDSVSGTYYNSVENNLPSQRQGGRITPQDQADAARSEPLTRKRSIAAAAPSAAAYASMPLRSPARVLRLWVKPWEDADGDLMDQLYVYVPVDNGRWLVDHAQRRIRDAYAPVKAARKIPTPSGDADGDSAKADTRLPAASELEQRLKAARSVGPSAANASGASDDQ